jgi:hypothetical protein
MLHRLVYGFAALFYAGFAAAAASMLLAWGPGASSDQAARDWTAWLLAKPFGAWIVGTIGLAIVATGVGVAVAGCRGEIRRRLDIKEKPRLLVTALGMAGSLTRALVFMLIGMFVVFAALDVSSREAKGLAGALRVVQRQQHGSALLALTGAGFLAFGAFGAAEAAYRRIRP